jgi:hypothetical protein
VKRDLRIGGVDLSFPVHASRFTFHVSFSRFLTMMQPKNIVKQAKNKDMFRLPPSNGFATVPEKLIQVNRS